MSKATKGTKLHIIYADGIGSNQAGYTDGQSILYKVVERLIELDSTAKATRVNWPASMATVGGSHSWVESSRIGVVDVDRIMREHPGSKFILLGYSGGNRVIHEWLDQANKDELATIAAVGLMSDPYRPRGRKQNELPETRGWGICGERPGPIPSRTFWTTVPGDVISDALPDAILRTPADASGVMPGEFVGELQKYLKTGNLQLAWQLDVFKKNPLGWLLGLGPRLHQARLDITGYLTGTHTTAYVIPYAGGASLAHRLANSINWHINH